MAAAVRAQAWGLVVLMALDLWTTHTGLELQAAEGNPVGVALLGHGFMGLVIAKAIATSLILGAAAWMWKDGDKHQARNQAHAKAVLMGCCSVMLAFVAWNSWVIMLQS